jgi:hypothetical protein
MGSTDRRAGPRARDRGDLLSVVDPATGDKFLKAEEGSRYVAVEVHLENTGPIDYSDSPTNGAVFIDVNSHQYGTWLGSGVEPTLDGTVRISPEGEVTNIFGRVTQS